MKPVAIAVSTALMLSGCTNWVQYTPVPASYTEIQPPSAESAFFKKTPFERAFDDLKLGNYAAAEPFLVQQLADHPEDPYALLAMGTVLEQTDRPSDALIYYRLAARYGVVSPLGETIAADRDMKAQTISDLAISNIEGMGVP